MKKIKLILLFFVFCIFTFSQNTNQKIVYYKYSSISEYDNNATLVNRLYKNGMIIFYEVNNLDFISVIVGNEIRDYGNIISKKTSFNDSDNPDRVIKEYLVNMEVMKENIPLKIFEIYEKSISEYIPFKILIQVYNSQTYELSRNYIFDEITLGLNSHWKRYCENQTYEYIDLGLSVKWATCNIGGNSPEDCGVFFAWGEVEPKSKYDWNTYKHSNFHKPTKYCTKITAGNNNFTDNKTSLEFSDDAAYVNLGCNWRMPTLDEFYELKTQCTWTWISYNGVNGYKVIGPNGNSIFLPASGYIAEIDRNVTVNVNINGEFGGYWTNSLSTHDPHSAFALFFSINNIILSEEYRCYGKPIRPVCP